MLQLEDAHRLATLDAYGLMVSPDEAPFEAIAEDAAAAFTVPIAIISLIDDRRQWFKARVGIASREHPIEESICALTIRGDEPLVVGDARDDPRFRDLPSVQGGIGIRFYAGVALRLRNGVRVGTLCVMDVEPRETFDRRERQALKALARRTVAAFELWREMRDAAAALALDAATDTLIEQAMSSLVAASAALERVGATSALAHLEQVIAMVGDLSHTDTDA